MTEVRMTPGFLNQLNQHGFAPELGVLEGLLPRLALSPVTVNDEAGRVWIPVQKQLVEQELARGRVWLVGSWEEEALLMEFVSESGSPQI